MILALADVHQAAVGFRWVGHDAQARPVEIWGVVCINFKMSGFKMMSILILLYLIWILKMWEGVFTHSSCRHWNAHLGRSIGFEMYWCTSDVMKWLHFGLVGYVWNLKSLKCGYFNTKSERMQKKKKLRSWQYSMGTWKPLWAFICCQAI